MPSDYSSIENRVLHWLAEDYEALEDFRNELDQYCTMAAARYHLSYDEIRNSYKAKVQKYADMRQMGKVIILGCLAESTLVLTQSGAKLIKDLCLADKVWDGENWVGHSGSVYKGKKLCVSFNRVLLTKDHEVFVSDTKEEVWRHEGNTQSEAQAICLVIGKLLSSYQELSLLNEMLATTSSARYAVLSLTKFWQDLKKVCQLNAVLAAEKPNISLAYQHIVSLQGSIKRLSIDLSTDGTPLKPDALCQAVVTTRTTEAGVFKCVKNGLSLLDLLLRMLWDYQDLTTPISSSTELIMTDTTLLATSGSVRAQKTCLTEGPLSQRTEGTFQDTYDVLNAGPNSRFTVLTVNGPMLVSNCGFGMGKDKFKDTADLQFGMVISEEESTTAVKAYRAKYTKVVDLWRNLKNAAVKAVISGQRVQVGRITFATAKVKGRIWLAMQLPSGKCIYYPEPSVVQRFIPGYESMGKVPTVTHAGVNPKTKQWGRQALIPGRITENAVQGTARECMAYGLMNVKNKMPYVRLLPSVHDESISLIKKEDHREGILDEYNYHLCDVPWADGLPLKAVGWIGNRYKKD